MEKRNNFITLSLGGDYYLSAQRMYSGKLKVRTRIPSSPNGRYYTIEKRYISGKSIPFLMDLFEQIKLTQNKEQ